MRNPGQLRHSRGGDPLRRPGRHHVPTHADQIERYGGAPGRRDDGALRDAMARPEQRHHCQPESTLYQLAAAYGFGIAKAHAFVDGNKRIAFAVAHVFLLINGQRIDATDREVEHMMLALAAGISTKPTSPPGSTAV